MPFRRPRSPLANRCRATGATVAGRPAGGFNMVELVIGVLVSTLLITAAVRALIALVRTDTVNQQELNRKDSVDRVLSLIQDEVRGSKRIETSGLSSATTPNCSTNLTPTLVLRGSSSAGDVAYLLSPLTTSGTYTTTGWIGPRVLVRCGPPYAADGTLNTAQAATAQVILDSLSSTNGFTLTAPTTASGTLNRTLQINLNSSARGVNDSTSTVASSVQVPINSNQEYGVLAAGASCSNATTGCLDPADTTNNTIFFTPSSSTSTTINGRSGPENIIYFSGDASSYTIGGNGGSTCNSTDCTVTTGSVTTTIKNGSVLIFRNTQIRIP
ncbi:MAG: type II secretion system protein J [Cyanobium sp.]